MHNASIKYKTDPMSTSHDIQKFVMVLNNNNNTKTNVNPELEWNQ